MDIHKDFAALCSLLNAKGVEFLIVGGYAVAFHGAHVERMLAAPGGFRASVQPGFSRFLVGCRDDRAHRNCLK